MHMHIQGLLRMKKKILSCCFFVIPESILTTPNTIQNTPALKKLIFSKITTLILNRFQPPPLHGFTTWLPTFAAPLKRWSNTSFITFEICIALVSSEPHEKRFVWILGHEADDPMKHDVDHSAVDKPKDSLLFCALLGIGCCSLEVASLITRH